MTRAPTRDPRTTDRRCWRRTTGLLALLGWLVALPTAAATLSVINGAASYPEGPLWQDHQLYYVEYAASNIRVWDGRTSSVYWHQDGCGANALIPYNGHLLVACYDNNTLVELAADRHVVRVLRTDVNGHPFQGPNDVTSDGHGGVYFSASGVYDLKAPISGAVLHLSAADGAITVSADTIHYSNGLTLSPDGTQLWVAEMLAGRVLSFPVLPDGRLGPRTVWARLQDLVPPTPQADAYNGPDGMKIGPDGNVYITQNGSGRVLVVDTQKRLVRIIEVPTAYVTNVGFGEPGSGDIIVTGTFDQWQAPYLGAVYRWHP